MSQSISFDVLGFHTECQKVTDWQAHMRAHNAFGLKLQYKLKAICTLIFLLFL